MTEPLAQALRLLRKARQEFERFGLLSLEECRLCERMIDDGHAKHCLINEIDYLYMESFNVR